MSNPLSFTSFKTDQTKYTLPQGDEFQVVTFSGTIDNQGYQPAVYVDYTDPNSNTTKLEPFILLEDGTFQTAMSLTRDSLTGQYMAQAHFYDKDHQEIDSDNITFQVD